MADDAVAEEGRRAPVRLVDELIDEHDVARREPLGSEPTAEIDSTRVAPLLQRVDVRAVVDLRRQEAVPAAVARQEEQPRLAELAADERARRLAEGRRDGVLAHVVEAFEIVEAAASQNAENHA